MSLKEQLEEIIILEPDVDLKSGEWCFFEGKAEFGTPIEKVTTKKKPGIGVVVPVTKHLGLGIARTKTKTKHKIVWDKTKCKLYLTNQRIIIKGKKNTVPLDLDDLNGINLPDDMLILTDAWWRENHFFMSKKDLRRFQETWSLAREASIQKLDLSTLEPTAQ